MASRVSSRQGSEPFPVVPRGRVLLVEEDPADLHFFFSILQGNGFQVHACGSYADGVRYLDSEAFDLVIVGQGSPNFEGRCVLERAIEIDRRMPVLVVARCIDMPCYLEAMQLGAIDYLPEPLRVEELVRAVENHLRVPKHAA